LEIPGEKHTKRKTKRRVAMSHLGRLRVALGLVLVGLVFAGAPPGVDAQTTSASVTG